MNVLSLPACGLLLGIALAAAGIPIGPSSLRARAVVSSSHPGSVLDMAADEERGLFFSVGENGFLRVWDSQAGSLVRKIAVTHSLVRIDLAMGETAPIRSTSSLTSALVPDPQDDRLYALGIGPDGRTRLTRYDGPVFGNETAVDGSDGSWAAVMADGSILGSADGRRKVGILLRGKLWESGKKYGTSPFQEKAPGP